jgi:hypothetical protein
MNPWRLKHVTTRITNARTAALAEHRAGPARTKRWIVHDTPLIWAVKNGDRLNGCSFVGWRRRQQEIAELLATYPDADEIVVQGTIYASDNKAAHEAYDHERYEWEARVWAPTQCPEDLWPALTPWRDAKEALTGTSPTYRPSMDVSDPDMRLLADDYDAIASMLGDERRTYRYREQGEASTSGQKERGA